MMFFFFVEDALMAAQRFTGFNYRGVPWPTLPMAKRFTCEKDPWKNDVILAIHRPENMFVTAESLTDMVAERYNHNEPTVVPHVDFLMMAWVCRGHSMLNMNRKSFLNCLQTGSGESGSTFADASKILELKEPVHCALEIVSSPFRLEFFCLFHKLFKARTFSEFTLKMFVYVPKAPIALLI